MVMQTGIEPKACSIDVWFIVYVQILQSGKHSWCGFHVTCVYAIVLHAVFMNGSTGIKNLLRGFLLCPKWVHRGKKIAAQKIWIVTLSFSDGDSRPLVTKY